MKYVAVYILGDEVNRAGYCVSFHGPVASERGTLPLKEVHARFMILG